MDARWVRMCGWLLTLGAAVLVTAGCGGGEATRDDAPRRTAPAGDVDVRAKLQVRLDRVGGKDAQIPIPAGIACTRSIPATCRAEIECPVAADDEGSDNGLEARRRCAWLATDAAVEALQPPSDDPQRACTLIYGGPERAFVTGTLDGEEIDVSFSRNNGCELARWEAAEPLWNARGGDGA